jgi:predicted site-specific integrase-resolvase
MAKSYDTRQAARRIGVSFRTLNRWLGDGTIKPSEGVPYGGGRVLWRWTNADIAKGRRIKGTQKPGPKAKLKRGKVR